MSCTQNKISTNNSILLNDVLRPNLVNKPFASCFLINSDFLVPHIAHFVLFFFVNDYFKVFMNDFIIYYPFRYFAQANMKILLGFFFYFLPF